jgi:hypothetical protein
MKAAIFLDSANHERFFTLLQQFGTGVKKCGDSPNFIRGHDCDDSDINIIFGSWKNRTSSHHVVKNEVLRSAKPFICIETPLLGRRQVSEHMRDEYFRVGINGFLFDTGTFNSGCHSNDRWKKIQKDLNVNIQPWRESGNKIIIPLQLPGDASLRGENITKWCYESAATVRQYTDKPIEVRTPQLVREFEQKYISKLSAIENLSFQDGKRVGLIESFKNAHATVTYTSGYAVDSVVNGIPTIACNPGNFTYNISSNLLKDINDPKMAARGDWLANLSYSQWHRSEIESGETWAHLKGLL